MAAYYLQAMIEGFLISLAGALPLGNLNVTAMYIAAAGHRTGAFRFAAGVAVVEMIYLLISLYFLHVFADNSKLYSIFGIVSVVVMLVFGLMFLFAGTSAAQRSRLIDNKWPRLLQGAFMSAVNPLQIPFWAGWGLYLMSITPFFRSSAYFPAFALGAAAGTFIALSLFIVVGTALAAFMQRNSRVISIATGLLFFIMAGIQLIKLIL